LNPLIAVAGLNPHNGDNGLFGTEELTDIGPAVEAAKEKGINAIGPCPADSVFNIGKSGKFDAILSLYHDQGHIPLKVVGFRYDQALGRWEAVEGVNITLGLPIIRTSVDHGTAFDQAGTGQASQASLLNAIDYAISFAKSRAANHT